MHNMTSKYFSTWTVLISFLFLSCSSEETTRQYEINLRNSSPHSYIPCSNKLIFSGKIETTESVDEVGYVIAVRRSVDRIGPTEMDLKFVALTNINTDTLFSIELNNPYPDSTYLYRPFAKIDDDYIYSEIIYATHSISNDSRKTSSLRNITIEEMSNFPGIPRSGAVSFTANGYGYLCCGFDGIKSLNDFWKYDPKTDGWERLTNYPGKPSVYHTAFVIDSFAYVFYGAVQTHTGSITGTGETYKYNIYKDDWTELESNLSSSAYSGVSFVSDNSGYITDLTSGGLTNIIQYNPQVDFFTNRPLNSGLPSNNGNMALSVMDLGYILFTGSSTTSIHSVNPADNLTVNRLSSSNWRSIDGLAFPIDHTIYNITGKGLGNNIGRIGTLLRDDYTLFCNNGEGLRRSEACGFLFENELIITTGIDHSIAPYLQEKYLSSTYKVTIPF